jgi:hypothetical protein
MLKIKKKCENKREKKSYKLFAKPVGKPLTSFAMPVGEPLTS